MSAKRLYQRIKGLIQKHVSSAVDDFSLERISLYVMGALKAKNGSPAQVARHLEKLGLCPGKAESLERRIRRMNNDPELTAENCVHPLAKAFLRLAQTDRLLLILDPTLQEDRLVMVSLNVWYRARALPLVWTIWPANQPLQGAGFWERVKSLLAQAASLLPDGVAITIVADRAFGTPAFTDLADALGWDWVVRVQDQTLYRDRQGREGAIGRLVRFRNQRKKLRGWAFKKAGWRAASIVVYWGRRHKKPLCLVSSAKPTWEILRIYRRRFPIEGTFRDYKSYGWRWEQGQVKDLQHMEHLLVGMALATWITLMIGTWRAQQLVAQPPTGHRYTRPPAAKLSLFQLGLDTFEAWLFARSLPRFDWFLSDWLSGNWSTQLTAHHAHAFVFAP